MRADAVFSQNSVRGFSGSNIALIADEPLTKQLRHADLVKFGELIFGRHYQHQFVMAESDGDDLAALGRIGHDPEVDFTLEQVFIDLIGSEILEMDIYLRV